MRHPLAALTTLLALAAPALATPDPAPGDGTAAYPRGASEPGAPLRAWPGPDAGSTEPPNRARALATAVDGPDATDLLLLAPRLVLALPRAALLLLARPLEGLTAANERYQIVQHVYVAVHNRRFTAGVAPTLTFITDFGTSLGVRAFHHDVLGHGESLSLLLEFGGSVRQRYVLAFGGDHAFGAPAWLRTRFVYEEDPSDPFFGLGDPPAVDVPAAARIAPDAGAVETRYRQDTLAVAAGAGPVLDTGALRLRPGLHLSYARRSFGPAERGGDPSIETVYDVGELAGFVDEATTLEALASVGLQLKLGDGPGALGVEAFAGRTLPVGDFEYWRWGAETSLRLDLYRDTRVLRLAVGVLGVTGDQPPFFALPALGGAHRLRGYLTDRFRDETALLASVGYDWYVNSHLTGLLFAEVGRVASTSADLFGGPLDRWHPSGGLGIAFGVDGATWFRAVAAYGDALRIYLATDFSGLVRTGRPSP